jgi:repressor LexA
MPKPLSDLERRVLDYIVEYLRSNTYQPSIREIGREFSIKSTKTVSELLHSLAVKGWIERDPSRSRGVRLLGVEMRAQTVSVPLFDAPDTAQPAGHLELDRKLVSANGAYLLPALGDGLTEDGIRPGDLLLVEPVDVASIESGDVLVVSVGGASRVHRCMRDGDGVVLEPHAVGEGPVHLTAAQAATAVQGRATGVIRRLRALAVNDSIAAGAIPA